MPESKLIVITGATRGLGRAMVERFVELGHKVLGCGRSTSPEVAPYCATKWAIEGLSQALSQELPSGLAAIAFNPGIINTDMLQSCFGGSASRYPTADEWSRKSVPFLLQLGPQHNGRSLDVE